MFTEVKEKLKLMGYEVKLEKGNDIVIELLKETDDKTVIDRILELMSLSAIQNEKLSKSELKELVEKEYSVGLNKLLCYSFLSKEDIMYYAKILSGVEDEVLLTCIRDVMCSSTLYEKNIVLDAIILLKSSKESYQREVERNILLNSLANKENISFDLAKKVLESKEEYQARGIGELLYEQETIDRTQVLKAADSINNSKSKRQALFVQKLSKDDYYKETGLLIPTLRIIDELKDDYQLDYIKKTVGICKEPIILLPSLKMYTETTSREECEKLQNQLSKIKKEDVISSLDSELSLISATKTKIKEKTI